jgi:hypothetical protein
VTRSTKAAFPIPVAPGGRGVRSNYR